MADECKYGHSLSGNNLYVTPAGHRKCRICARRRYQEFKVRHGMPDREGPGHPPNTIDDIINRLVICESGCIEWPGSKQQGYGQALLHNRKVRVHRAVFEHLRGPVPEDRVLHHECRNRSCANPDHLRVCTVMENTLLDHPDLYGRYQRSKTHCKLGHPLSGDNLYRGSVRGERRCRECQRLHSIRNNVKKREKRAALKRLREATDGQTGN